VENNVNILAADTTGDLRYVDADNLIVGTVNPTGITTGGSTFIQTRSGNLTLNAPITANGPGNAITLVAANNFINNAGAAALQAPNGRFLVYSTDPALNVLGGLTGAEQCQHRCLHLPASTLMRSLTKWREQS
jgi:hypothetical protein